MAPRTALAEIPVGRLPLMGAFSVGLAAWLLLGAQPGRRFAQDTVDRAMNPTRRCDDAAFGCLNRPGQMALLLDRIEATGWPAFSRLPVRIDGPRGPLLTAMHYWSGSSGLRWRDPIFIARRHASWALALPHLEGDDLSSVRGARNYGGLIMVPALRRIEPDVRDDARVTTVTVPRAARAGQYLAVVAAREPGRAAAPTPVTATLHGRGPLRVGGWCDTDVRNILYVLRAFELPADAAGQSVTIRFPDTWPSGHFRQRIFLLPGR